MKVTTASPPGLTFVAPGRPICQAPVPDVGIAREPSDGLPPLNEKPMVVLAAPGAAWTTNRCGAFAPAAIAPICQLPWKSRCPVPALAPDPDAALYTTTPSRSAARA